MGNVLIASEKSLSLPKKQRKKNFSKRPSTTSVPEQEHHLIQNIYPTIQHEQVSEACPGDDDDYYFENEEEEEPQWSLERRTATLRNTKRTTEVFLNACNQLKENVSTKVDALLQDLPDAHDPEFVTKYRAIRQQIQNLFPMIRNKSKQQTKKKK